MSSIARVKGEKTPPKKKIHGLVRRGVKAVKTKRKKGLRAMKTEGKNKPKAGKTVRAETPEAVGKPGFFKTAKFPRHAQTRLLAFVRDPRCLFVYWEIAPESFETAWRELKEEYPSSERVLRILRVSPDGRQELFQETKVQPWEMNRYIHLPEGGGSYIVEVGQKSISGKFVPFAVSGRITTALGCLSPVTEPGWAPAPELLEYYSEEEEVFERPESGIFSASLGRGPVTVARKRGTGLVAQRIAGSHYAGSRY